ncbi:MAG: GNAT family N-acetyltransferase [Deltaproteobacteria bacterium]|nr:GNAT family N-acetyltransferase [Deltaproteobacteria bacterium]
MVPTANISIRRFTESDLDAVRELIYATIDVCYTDVYPEEAIHFFKDFYAPERILRDAKTGFTLVLEEHDRIIATGTIIGDHAFRVFVTPGFQKRGYGKLIMSKLEKKAGSNGFDTVVLDSSLVSKRFCDDLGYEKVREAFIELPNGKRLDYYEMKRSLKR